MLRIFTILGFILWLTTKGNAQPHQSAIGSTRYFDTQIPKKADKELQFFAFFINQGVSSNIFPTNEFLRGQVVGRLYGRNTATSSDTASSYYVEQRIIPFFIYTPKLFQGKATLRASFEIDWTWGDVAYGTGGNLGAAISADQVNIQTQNVQIEYRPWKNWFINLGLMRMFDSPFDVYRTTFDKMANSAYRLSYWGTDAAGISILNTYDFSRYKMSWFKFYENDIYRDDDVDMFEFYADYDINPRWKWGFSGHYVRDRASGKGGVSILGQGLNSLLAEYNGTFKFRFGNNPYQADIYWIGSYFSRNIDMMQDTWFASGFFNYNFGSARTRLQGNDTYTRAATIGGFGANLRAGYRYGQTTDDHFKVDGIFTTGDENGITDQRYSGVLTGNTWGSPAAIFISSGAYLLLPHANVVNRFMPIVADISNIGYGLNAWTYTLSKGFIPHKLIGKIGGAFAWSNAAPIGGTPYMGRESNFSLVYNLGPFMSVELHGAKVWLGGFFDSADDRYGSPVNGGLPGQRPVDPWTVFALFKWLMF
jgi:hypothetical protein